MTASVEDYLEAIYMLSGVCPCPVVEGDVSAGARIKDIAAKLQVKMPSVINAITELKRLQYVTQEPYGAVILTQTGRERALEILRRHQLLTRFLIRIGVGEDNAERDACKMEHILSQETIDRIRAFLLQ
ncbi:MAG: metal-dependent transcriptional regulator [Kiritimatiellae bacterium]|nr:metal-dependent transcriptional regulator [Kiritimatiellia bacterium]